MDWKKCEQLLGSLKGEESVFDLYHIGKKEDINELYNTFLQTNLPSVNKLDRLLSGEECRRKMTVASVYGEKGVGKSTLCSTGTIVHFSEGNIRRIFYNRYEPNLQQFRELFVEEGEKGNYTLVVYDDIHYFIQDFIKSIKNGSVSLFDRFTMELVKLNKLRTSDRSLLLYITDRNSLDYLRDVLGNLLRPFDREDLLRLLPPVSKPSYEIEINEDFFRKTYSLLKGKIKFFNACRVNTKLLEGEIGVKVSSPRMFKILMKGLESLDKDLFELYKYPSLAEEIIRGITSTEGSLQHPNKLQETITQNLLYRVNRQSECYSKILKEIKEGTLTEAREVYERVGKIVRRTISDYPHLFSLQDRSEIEELAKNPEKIWEKVNKNAILSVLERDILSY